MGWKTIESQTLVSGYWVTVRKNHVQLPGGQEIKDFYTVTIPDAVGIIAITEDGEVLLKKEYRYSCGEDLIEFPAGTFDPGETDALAVARRELLEETGYASDRWTSLGATVESSSKLTNRMHLFLAQDCRCVGELHLDPTEEIEVLRVSMDRAIDMVMKNEVCCNSTAHAILKAARLLGR